MGDAADYLRHVLDAQTLEEDDPEAVALTDEHRAIRTALIAAFGARPPDVQIGGSLAKGTLVKAGYDLDVICYFANESTVAGATLADIFASVRTQLQTKYATRDRRSSIRLTSRRNGNLPFTVDVVPGRFVDETRQDVFLHQTEGEKDRLKTNLRLQIDHVKNSGFVDAIRLAKLWRLRADVPVRTFLLELLCIEALRSQAVAPLDDQLVRFWTLLRDDIDSLDVRDPANPTGNDLSPLLEESGAALSSAASVALDLVRAGDWTSLFGEDADADLRVISPRTLLKLGDTSHAVAPIWPVRRGTGSVRIEASARRGFRWAGPRWKRIDSDGHALLEDTELRFHAHVANVPAPYEIKWQVVNTGQHAAERNGLRGDQFFGGHSLKDPKVPSEDQHVNYERIEYTGKHWIECLVIKDGQIWARSGAFYINAINRRRQSRWYLR